MIQSILKYLEQPSLLSEVPLDELVRLVEQYPYSTNLRLLVLLKAKIVNSSAYENYLNEFSASTFDRAHLYHLVRALESGEEERGEVLELLELEELELAPLPAANLDEPLPSRMNELPPPGDPVPLVLSPDEPEPDDPDPETDMPPTPRPTPARPGPSLGGWVDSATAFSYLISSGVGEGQPEDPDSFSAVLRHRRAAPPLHDRLLQLRRHSAPSLRAPAPTTNGEGVVVSETLAGLLVRQGQYQSAIRMYQRLGLLYPDKKPIFAGLIQELKEKL